MASTTEITLIFTSICWEYGKSVSEYFIEMSISKMIIKFSVHDPIFFNRGVFQERSVREH